MSSKPLESLERRDHLTILTDPALPNYVLIDGTDGNDVIRVSPDVNQPGGVIIDMNGETRTMPGIALVGIQAAAGDDLIIIAARLQFAMAHGGDGSDTIVGSTGRDNLFGDAGNDVLNGRHGRDSLRGDVGDDLIFGGAGPDLTRWMAEPDITSWFNSCGSARSGRGRGVLVKIRWVATIRRSNFGSQTKYGT